MKIIYIAYSCDPFNGSEDQIGWNIPFYNSQNNKNEIFVITKREQKNNIEKYFKEKNIYPFNIHFYYVDIPQIYKKIFSDFLYSGRLNLWHRRAIKIAKKICKENEIDIIHQLTPIEFRAIGKYYRIKNIKYVVGPIGGGVNTPKSLKEYAKSKVKIEIIRKIINRFYGIRNANIDRKKCDYIIYSNYETATIFKDNKPNIYPEIGINPENILEKSDIEIKKNDNIIFLVIGRLIYLKGHKLLLDAVEKIPEKYTYKVKIIGDGTERDSIEQIINKSSKLKKHIELCGKIQYEEMKQEYDNGNVLVLPSIRDNSPTVILEALSRGVPVIAYNGFGAKVIIDEECGYLYYGTNRDEVIQDLKDKMIECMENKNRLKEKSLNALNIATQNSWKEKIKYYNKIYDKLLKK